MSASGFSRGSLFVHSHPDRLDACGGESSGRMSFRYTTIIRNPTSMTTTSQDLSTETHLLRAAYAAFNARDIDAALVLMTPDVTWPRAFKGGFVRGPEEVRVYWTEQWSEIDPNVEPVGFQQEEDGTILVEVRQVVKDLEGKLLADDTVHHRFTLENGLIRGMDVA